MTTKIIKDYPMLYKKDKSDNIRVWKLKATMHSDNTFWIETEYGQKDGKIIHGEKQVKEGKNIGKKNETTTEQQTVLVCDKTFKDKKEKEEYIETLDDVGVAKTDISFSPMLADTWDPSSKTKRKIDILFPCLVQPKLDGIRCLTYVKNNEIVNQSRQLKYFKNLVHINDELKSVFSKFPNIVLDGELYNHDIVFNQIAGIVKKEKLKPEDKEKLEHIQYHVYDCFLTSENKTATERFDILNKLKKSKFKYLKFVETYNCENKDEVVNKYHPLFIEQKYEGISNFSFISTGTRTFILLLFSSTVKLLFSICSNNFFLSPYK